MKKIGDYLWEIEKTGKMRVPARFYSSEEMLKQISEDRSLEQLVNGASMSGIQEYALCMPDCHEGYSVPIGFVGAVSIREGVVSPGACGFDINCLPPTANVLLANGSFIPIGKLKYFWQQAEVKFVHRKDHCLRNSKMIAFLKKYNNPRINSITIQSGERIEATKDHPFQTKQGMKKACDLKKGEFILTYPFKGVEYERPSSVVVLTQEHILRTLEALGRENSQGSAITQILNQLKKRNLLPLRLDSEVMPSILKVMGFIFGDGVISFVRKKTGSIHFYGQPEDLEEIRADIKKIGFSPSNIYTRDRQHAIKTFYGLSSFAAREHSVKLSCTALAVLLVSLGVPFGTKSHQTYSVPSWLFKCALWQKRLFLAAFFGAELSTPKTVTAYNFYNLQLSMQKQGKFSENAKSFLEDIGKLLKEFGVETVRVSRVPGYSYRGKQGKTEGFRMQIQGKSENLVGFFERVGYEYNKKKQREACLALSYLKRKLLISAEREKARKEIRKLYKKKGDFKRFAQGCVKEYVPLQFLYRSLFKEKSHGFFRKRGKPRVPACFPSFEQHKRERVYGKEGLVWERIEKIEEQDYKDFVYDFTINQDSHNFIANGFVVSNCGMRLLKSPLLEKEIRPHLEKLSHSIQREVPSGLGRGRKTRLSLAEIDKILEEGSQYLVKNGYGTQLDIENCEAEGRLAFADSSFVSERAKKRGSDQVGTLGSGNHFLEIQKVAEIFDVDTAKAFGLFPEQVVIMIHTGSRGLGHQVCSDYLKLMIPKMKEYGIEMPDEQFACCPFSSPEGKSYFSAMAGAANFAWANRQMIAYSIRRAWGYLFKGEPLESLYDVAHNIIKKEKYVIGGKEKEVAVHRKGATRAFPKNHPELSLKYQNTGQPVLIPGSMGTCSYVLVGTEAGRASFYSTSHGAGRVMSRTKALKTISGREVVDSLRKKGIVVSCHSARGVAEEAPQAYKDIDQVVEVVHNAGLSKKVAKLTPLAVIKGE